MFFEEGISGDLVMMAGQCWPMNARGVFGLGCFGKRSCLTVRGWLIGHRW
jgi:hypothetical protein